MNTLSSESHFLFRIDFIHNCFENKGVAVVGRIEDRIIEVGDEVEIYGKKGIRKEKCIGVEHFFKLLSTPIVGSNTAILLEGIKREDIEQYDVVRKVGKRNWGIMKRTVSLRIKDE